MSERLQHIALTFAIGRERAVLGGAFLTPKRRPARRVWWYPRSRSRYYDQILAVSASSEHDYALQCHSERITFVTARYEAAEALSGLLREAKSSGAFAHARARVHRRNIAASEDVIVRLILRLRDSEAVDSRGMARLRLLMSNGDGPLYRYGRGDLRGRLLAALSAL